MRLDEVGGDEEGGEPLQYFRDSVNSDEFEIVSEPGSNNEDSETDYAPARPVGDIYAFYAGMMLQAAQPYPGDPQPCGTDDCFNETRFLMYLISDNEYCIMDSEHIESLTIEANLLHDPVFMPVLWYAQACAKEAGLDPDEVLFEMRYLEEIGDVPSGAVQLLLEQYHWSDESDPVPAERFEVCPEGEDLFISD
jgi:hypothetical protein